MYCLRVEGQEWALKLNLNYAPMNFCFNVDFLPTSFKVDGILIFENEFTRQTIPKIFILEFWNLKSRCFLFSITHYVVQNKSTRVLIVAIV